MARLSAAQRREIWAEFMSALSSDREPIAVNKNDLRAAVDAIDTWISANAASVNRAIPLRTRTGLTPKQKARLFMAVARRRFEGM